MKCVRCNPGLRLLIAGVVAAPAWGQSSSLYVTEQTNDGADPFANVVISESGEMGVRSDRLPDPVSPQLRQASLAAVAVPEPRTYQVNDLVTIIIRESTTADIDASLNTEKEVDWQGEIAEFPKLNLADLLEMQVAPNTFPDGTPKLDVNFNNEFEGDGQYEHNTEMTARLAARIIDIKPNGLMVLEARKFVENDDETMTLVVTGTASVDSVQIDNTVLSSDLYDLHISKQHTGELRKTTKKGLLSNLMDFIFNF